MASDIDASCESDPNFGVVCAFLEKFGAQCGLTNIDFLQLQNMLESTTEVPKELHEMLLKLLRKTKKSSVSAERWEKALVNIIRTCNIQDAWEVERFGYKKAKLSSKVRILKYLLEMQFDYHVKFKAEVNKISAPELRSQPLGRDKSGHAYWFLSDDNYQIRVYKEDLDDETWKLVAKDRTGLVNLISQLSDGDSKFASDSAGNEDSNSMSDKPIIDTGQQDSKKTTPDDSEDSNHLKKLDKPEVESVESELKISNLSDLIGKRTSEEGPIVVLQKLPKIHDKTVDKSGEKSESKIVKPLESISESNDVTDSTEKRCNAEGSSDGPIVVLEKLPKITIKSFAKCVEISEAIEEPVMKIKGEGAGAENQSVFETTPIVGEEIAEDVMFFFGTGDGAPCQTGNKEGDEQSNSKCNNESVSKKSSTDNKENPSENTKNDSSPANSKELDCKEDCSTPKKIQFFFGAGSQSPFKSSVFSPALTLAFGSPKKDTKNGDSKEENSEDDHGKDHFSKLDEKEDGSISLGLEESNINTKEDSAEHKEANPKSALNISTNIPEKSSNEHIDKPKELVVEPICIKKVAYICGDGEESKSGSEKTMKSENLKQNTKQEKGTVKNTIKALSKKSSSSTDEILKKKQTSQEAENNSEDKEERTNVNGDNTNNTDKQETKISLDKKRTVADLEPEVVYVKGRITRSNKNAEVAVSNSVRELTPTSSNSNSRTNKHVSKPVDKHSTESSIANSPQSTVESVISIECAENTSAMSNELDLTPEQDPLAVSDQESEKTEEKNGDPKKKPVISLTSFSLDYNNSSTPPPLPVIPSLRSLRKRMRNVSPPEIKEEVSGKKAKIKGRRQVDTKLRKSIEEQKNQQVSSSENENEIEEKKAPKVKKKNQQANEPSEDSHETPVQKPKKKKGSRMLANLGIHDTSFEAVGVRASRRIAQMKIREQVEPKKGDQKSEDIKSKKKNSKEDKEFKPEKRKRNKFEKEDESTSEPEIVAEKKKKKRKEKAPSKIFNENRPWQSSSESSEEDPHATDEEEEEPIEYEDEDLGEPKSDHEFSPESDIEDENWQPLKRARTARKEDEELDDECVCQKCGKCDHPEWILLCDKCDNGWHCSCLRPPLLEIPEGDWFCPPCQHIKLLENLQAKLKEYDKMLNKKQLEDRRKERLAYVGISLNNVLPSKDLEYRKKRRHSVESGSGSTSRESSSGSESESDSDEPIYQLRQRRQAKSYKFSEYDEMIKSALGDDIDEPKKEEKTYGRGKDINTIINAEKQEKAAAEKAEREAMESEEIEGKPPVVPKDTSIKTSDEFVPPKGTKKRVPRRKPRKLTGLDVSSDDDDYSDEDFKGTSSEESEEEEEESDDDVDSNDSDDYVGRKRRKNAGPVRRSTRARVSRYDTDFINDDSDDAPKKKKKRSIWDESESDSSDWGGRRKKKGKSKKKSRNSSDGRSKKPKSRIKYGGLTSSDEDLGRGRRTRGKKTTYVDSLVSDESDEQIKKKTSRRIESDDDEDFVANEDDEKDSEENVDDPEEEDNDEDDEVERRPLCVPKIYIKKPSTEKLKEIEALRSENERRKLPEIANKVQNELKADAAEKKETLQVEDPKKNKIPAKKIENPEEMKKIEAINQELKNTIDEINKDLENMGSEDTEKMIEEEEFANKQLRLVAERLKLKQQLESSKQLIAPILKPPPALPAVIHEPIVGNVSALLKNDDENDDLSEPPGISLPMFTELAPINRKPPSAPAVAHFPQGTEESPKKRRGRGKGKKTLEEEARRLAEQASKEAAGKGQPVNIEIAAPPQPFSQTQPSPSVITRMLQNKAGQPTTYPIGSIRPKQFATMPDDDDDEPPRNRSRGSSPAASLMTGIPPPSRGGPLPPKGEMPPYRPPPSMNHYPTPLRGMPPQVGHHVQGAPPPHIFHRQMDPSPSGGGPVPEGGGHIPAPHGIPPSSAVPPAAGSPGSAPPTIRYPPMGAPPRTAIPYQYPPAGTNPPPPSYYGEYSPTPPPGTASEDPIDYGNVPAYSEPYERENPPEGCNKPYEEAEPSGEFGGLVSYFSSQHEDDLDS